MYHHIVIPAPTESFKHNFCVRYLSRRTARSEAAEHISGYPCYSQGLCAITSNDS